jgi:hypothetical protein
MGYTQFIGDDIATFYGTVQRNECVAFRTPIPFQIVGLVPTDPVNTDCVQDPCYTLCVVGEDADGNKDMSSFLYDFPDENGTATFALQDYDGATWSDVANPMGATEGTLHQIGSFPDYPSYGGFQIDWGLVYDNYGAGVYRFVVITDDVANRLISLPFQLKENTCANIENTFKIEITNQGSYYNINYTDDNLAVREYDLIETTWDDSVRYYGVTVMGEKETEEITTNYDSGRDLTVFGEDRPTFELKIPEITHQLIERLDSYGLMSASIKITDNNTNNQTFYNRLPIIKNGAYSFERFPRKKELFSVSVPVKNRDIRRYKKS